MPQAGSARIVFTSTRDGNAQIYSMNVDGSGLIRLTNNSYNDDHPRWSPNGTKILFQSDRNSIPPDLDNPGPAKQDIYVMNADGTSQTRLTTDAADDCNAVWSPDGNKIVFQSLRNGVYHQVYTMNADGTSQMNLSNGTAADYQPSWSPNGSKIGFASERDHAGAPSIYVMNANGSSQTRLTFSSEIVRDEQPAWSRDATRIAFVSTRDGNKEVYVMNANGSNQVRLTTSLENDDSPYWSPDGTQIVFRSERERDAYDPTQQLWMMNADGTSQALLASNEFGDSSPSWNTPGNQLPVANSGGSYNGVVAQNVPFSGTGSFDPDGTITSYAWAFGDGGTGSGVSPTHAYASAGTYTVTLTVTDNLGAQASATTSATITTAASEQYLANFNQWSLLRQPYANESSYWNDMLRAAYPNGQTSMLLALRELGKTLFESSEYAARNRDNHWYVYDLYKTYLMREPDAPGWAFWESVCNSNGRENVRRAFDECGEFASIVATLTPTGSPSSAVSSLATARVDPFNQPGNGLTARDAEWSVSLLSLPGRAGLDLGLSLSYSSMVWTHSGPYIYFDEDNGWPSPGFRIGFPTIQEKFFDAQAGRNVYLLMAGGSRISLRQLGTSNVYETADSSYLQLIDSGSSLLLRTTDGTQLSYQSFNNEWHCTQIKDRNGNYLTVNYNWLGHITTITDTLARSISFNYDANANLISITQSWTVNGVPQTHTWASFGWDTKTLQTSFSGVLVVGAPNGSTIPVLSQVGLDDGSHYTFEYTAAAQVNLIRSFRSDNVQRAYAAYDYQYSGDDCPRLSATRVSAENWTAINGLPSEVTTQYSDPGDGSHQLIAPDGTIYKEFYGSSWQRGLTTQSEVWSGGLRQKWTTATWTQDNTGVSYQTNPRITETNIYDAGGNRRRTTVSYTSFTLPSGTTCSLPNDTREYAADATTILRRTHVDYRMDPNLDASYLERYIIGLVKEQTLYEVNSGTETLMSRVGFAYDEIGSIQGTDAPAQHDNTNYNASFVAGRANLSSLKRYDVTDSSQFSVSGARYNTAGAMVSTTDPLLHQSSIGYAESFSDGNNSRNTFAYPTTVTDADGFSSYVQYNFDFGARTRVQGPPPAGQPQGLIQTLTYDSAARIDRVTTTNNGAYTRYLYGPNYVVSLATVNNVADEAYSNSVFDGVGRVTGEASLHPGSTGGYKAQLTQYDLMGRMVKQSNPAEIDGAWNAAGDDVAGWLYTQQTYDWKGRPRITTNTDLTTREASYTGCGCAGGEVVTLTDEGTIDEGVAKRRQQKIYSDVLGRTVKTEVLNWQGGSVYSTVTNSYNARDQITSGKQYQGDDASGVYQDTTMTYDGHGRLKTRHSPEQDPGTATTYNYNSDDTLLSVTDARGATQTLTYNARRLVTGISYSAPTGITIPVAVSFTYDGVGNRSSMSDGMGSASYNYNQLSRMISETRNFTGLSGSFTLNYAYNLVGELSSFTDPFGAQVGYNYDQTGRLSAVTGSGFASVSTYASSIQYRAWGALKSLAYGNTKTLSVGYNNALQATSYEVPGVLKKSYQYNYDGRLKFTQDQLTTNSKFDRSYEYDHMGRVTKALSGAEARGQGPTDDRPYNETLVYEQMNHLTMLERHNWDRLDGSGPDTVVNNRVEGWTYDADGRALIASTGYYVYDAAGRVLSFGDDAPYKTEQEFTGEGRRAKTVERRFDDQTNQWVTEKITYYVTSSVLGGALVTELNEQGAKQRTLVHAAGSVLASQTVSEGTQSVGWEHRDASGASYRSTNSAGEGIGSAEMDAVGANAGMFKPFTWNVPDKKGLPVPYPGIADMLNNPGGACTMDRMPIPCEIYNNLIKAGSTDAWIIYDDGTKEQREVRSFGVGLWGVWRDGRSGNSSNHIDYSGDTAVVRTNNSWPGWWDFFAFGSLPTGTTPQKPYDPKRPERPFSREEISSLIDDIFKLFKTPGCEEFVNDLLKTMNSHSGWDAGSISEILEEFRTTGFVAEYVSLNISGSAGNGGFDFSAVGRREQRASTALGEIIHTAGMAPMSHMNWLAYPNVYTDTEMSRAASELGVVMSKEQYEKTYKTSNGWLGAGHAAIEIRCNGAKNGMSPDNVKP